MRTAKEDIELLGRAGVWNGPGDRLMNAVILLCMHAKSRHKPVRNLHLLAKAVEKGDRVGAEKFYGRLMVEVDRAVPKYPDIEGTLETLSQLTDDDFARMERVMEEYDPD